MTIFAPEFKISLRMNKKILVPLILLIVALIAGAACLFLSLGEQEQVNKGMLELAELDKQAMENEYERFALQYSEMKTQSNNDSIIQQLTEEQMKTQQLLEEKRQANKHRRKGVAHKKGEGENKTERPPRQKGGRKPKKNKEKKKRRNLSNPKKKERKNKNEHSPWNNREIKPKTNTA